MTSTLETLDEAARGGARDADVKVAMDQGSGLSRAKPQTGDASPPAERFAHNPYKAPQGRTNEHEHEHADPYTDDLAIDLDKKQPIGDDEPREVDRELLDDEPPVVVVAEPVVDEEEQPSGNDATRAVNRALLDDVPPAAIVAEPVVAATVPDRRHRRNPYSLTEALIEINKHYHDALRGKVSYFTFTALAGSTEATPAEEEQGEEEEVKLFVGQLNKVVTKNVLNGTLQVAADDTSVNLLAIEHMVKWTQGAIGKGTCQVKVKSSVASVAKKAHRRAIFDKHGVWIARTAAEAQELETYAASLKQYADWVKNGMTGPEIERPRGYAPRDGVPYNLLVVEDATSTYVADDAHRVEHVEEKKRGRFVAVRANSGKK